MLKLKKYFKPFTIPLLIVVALLFGQAMADLALPEYMSNIVNNGIMSSGIDTSIPQAILASNLDEVMEFATPEEQQIIKDNYTLVNAGEGSKDQMKQFPKMESEATYVINDLTADEKVVLKDNMVMSLAVTNMMANLDSELVSSDPKMEALVKQIPEGMSALEFINSLPAEAGNAIRTEIRDGVSKQVEIMGTSIIDGMGKTAVKSIYKNLGTDLAQYQMNYILVSGVKMIGMTLLVVLFSTIVGFFAAQIGAGFARNLRAAVFDKITNLSKGQYEKFSTSTLITRTTNDITQIQQALVMTIRMVFYAPIVGVGAFLKVMKTGAGLTWIIGVVLAAMLVLIVIIFGLAVPKFKKNQILKDENNGVVREALTGLLVVRAFQGENYENQKIDAVSDKQYKLNLSIGRLIQLLMPVMQFVMLASSILIVWFGAYQVNDGIMDIGSVMAFMQYAIQIVMAFLMIAMLGMFLPSASVSAKRIAEVLDVEDDVIDASNVKTTKTRNGLIEFKGVSFKYPDAEECVLKDINLVAKPGEITAFIGSTGSGKSTIINLVPRLYDVNEGELLIDGVNVKDLAQADLHNKIGFVPQKAVLFTGTIEENIRYGKEDASMAEIEEAALIASAADFIEEKEDGYNSPVAQGGTNFSGGQKQRLSIARALVRKPEILIFDDSFSALDMKTDAVVRKSIQEMNEKHPATQLVVAQRVSSIIKADQIVVLDEGRIVGKGTHKELMENCEVYQEIAYSQLSKEELENE